MVSRTVSIILSAQAQGYLTTFKAAEDATRQLDARAKTMTETLRTQQAALEKHHAAMTKLGTGMGVVGAAAAAGLMLAVRAATEFGAKMAQLQSLSHANAATMQQLSNAAMTVGTAYGFSATQVADAQIELVKAGVSVQAQLGGALTGALTLAAAGQMDVASATEITTVAMTQFGLSAEKVPHLADLLAAGADKALGSVGDLGEALKNGGLQAANMGLTIDDTVGTLSAFAQAGILGAEAGTQLRSMFLRLQNPTAASKKVMEEYGISINDASGKFVGISKFADELHDKLGKLTDAQRNSALATMFGSHAIVGASVLYKDGGAAAEKAGTSIGDWIRNVNDSGFAAAQAAGKMNSLQGDAQKLAAVFQTDLIKAGSGANDALRAIVQTTTGALTAFGALPAPVQNLGVQVVALTAGVGILGGGFLIAVPKVVAFQAAVTRLGYSVKGTLGTFGKFGGLLASFAALDAMQQKSQESGVANTGQISAAADSLQKRLQNVDSLFKGNALVGAGIKNAFEQELSGEAANNKGLDVLGTHIGDVYRNHEGALKALGSQLAGMSKIDYSKAVQGFDELAKKVGAAGNTDKLNHLIPLLGPDYVSQLQAVAKGIGVTASQTNLLAIASGKGTIGQRALTYEQEQGAKAAQDQATKLADLSGQASTATANIDGLQKQIEGFGSAQLDARGATRAMYQAIDDATAAVSKNGHTLDVHTQKGRDNQAMLDGIATSADAAASKVLKQTGSVAKASGVMQAGRDAFVKLATQITGSGKAAEKMADQIGLIPGNITIAVKGTDLDPIVQKIKRIKDALNNLDGTTADVEVAVQVAGGSSATAAVIGRQLQLASRAGGGSIDGSGPKGVDSVPAILAPGEHVLTASDVDRLGGQGGAYAFRAALQTGQVGAYASGGAALRTAQERVSDAKRAVTKARTGAARRSAEDRLRRAERSLRDTRANIAAAAAVKAAKDRTTFRQDREDFVSGQRRATAANPIDPLSYVDQLRSMSRSTGLFSSRQETGFDRAANKYERALVKLEVASAKATEKLDALKQSSAQLHDSIAQAIAGGYQASGVPLTGAHDASTRDVASGWVTRGGIRMRNYSTVTVAADPGRVTAGGIASYYTAGAAAAKRFADDLARLAKRGLNPQLLSEIAGYGVAQGAPIATALLAGSAAQIAQVNSGYRGIGSAAGVAGTTVANDNYAAQIKAAEKNADKITKQIAADGEKLRKLIAKAFGLRGYATGTSSAEAGIRWVGEDGPELVGFRGGEAVLNRSDSARWVRGTANGGSTGVPPVEVNVAPFPDTITVQDASGFTATMRVVAHQVVSQRNDQIAVRVMSGA